MKYRIPEHIILQTIDSETIRDIIFHDVTEQELLVEILRNPRLNYYATDDAGNVSYYRNCELFTVNNVLFNKKI